MAFTGNYMCTSFKVELFKALHNFLASGGHTFKIALYTASATMDAGNTPVYTTTNEVVGTAYNAGGTALTCIDPTSTGTTAFCDFADASWAGSTITARGALIYNTNGAANRAVAVLDFGAPDKSSVSGTFTIVFPAADASNAILRLA